MMDEPPSEATVPPGLLGTVDGRDEGVRRFDWREITDGMIQRATRVVALACKLPIDLASDATAEAVIRLQRMKPEATNMQSLLNKSAVNVGRDLKRRGKRNIEEDFTEGWDQRAANHGYPLRVLVSQPEQPDQDVSREEIADRVNHSLERMPDCERELLTAVYVDGKTPGDLDLKENAKPGTNKVRLFRARERLRMASSWLNPER